MLILFYYFILSQSNAIICANDPVITVILLNYVMYNTACRASSSIPYLMVYSDGGFTFRAIIINKTPYRVFRQLLFVFFYELGYFKIVFFCQIAFFVASIFPKIFQCESKVTSAYRTRNYHWRICYRSSVAYVCQFVRRKN